VVSDIVAGGNRRTVLTGAVLPHPAARGAADRVTPEQALLVKPGDTISLTVSIEGTDDQRKRITDAITEQLKQNGISVAPGRPVTLTARTEHGPTREQVYERRSFGFGGPPARDVEKVTVTEKITRLFFEAEGKVAWETRTSSGVPMFVSSKQGQSIGQAVAEASQFNVAFLESVRVPAYVPRPSDTPWLGQSKWTMAGVADGQ
jgi:hypothetical protein